MTPASFHIPLYSPFIKKQSSHYVSVTQLHSKIHVNFDHFNYTVPHLLQLHKLPLSKL
jgi:hypothetical protein